MRTFRSSFAALALLLPVLFAAALILGCAPVWAQDLDALKADIAAQLEKVETYSADVKMTMDMGSMQMNFVGTVRGKGALFDGTTTMNIFGQKMANRTVVDADGVSWTEMDMMGEKIVTKSPADADDMGVDGAAGIMGLGFGGMFGGGDALNPVSIIESLEDAYTLTPAGKAMVDGTETFVIEGVMNDEARKMLDVLNEEVDTDEETSSDADANGAEPAEDSTTVQIGGFEPEGFLDGMLGMFDEVRVMLGTADGFPRKVEIIARDGTPTLTQTYSNIVLNQPMEDSSFAYTPPDDVEVMDMSSFDGGSTYTQFAVGDTPPDFEAPGLDGNPVRLVDFKGKVVLLDFWATWCGPCIGALPDLLALYDEYHPKGLEVIGISLDGDRADVDAFLKENAGMTWPQVFDGNAWDSAVAVLYGVEAIPLTVLVGKDGTIRGLDLHGDELKAAVAAALAQ